MDILKSILADKSSAMVASLLGKTGFSVGQAEAFVPEAASSVIDAVKQQAGDLDLAAIASNPTALTDSMDVAGLAGKVGIETDKARSGLQAILPILLGALREKAGSLDSLTSLLGGGAGAMGALGGKAGKLFGR